MTRPEPISSRNSGESTLKGAFRFLARGPEYAGTIEESAGRLEDRYRALAAGRCIPGLEGALRHLDGERESGRKLGTGGPHEKIVDLVLKTLRALPQDAGAPDTRELRGAIAESSAGLGAFVTECEHMQVTGCKVSAEMTARAAAAQASALAVLIDEASTLIERTIRAQRPQLPPPTKVDDALRSLTEARPVETPRTPESALALETVRAALAGEHSADAGEQRVAERIREEKRSTLDDTPSKKGDRIRATIVGGNATDNRHTRLALDRVEVPAGSNGETVPLTIWLGAAQGETSRRDAERPIPSGRGLPPVSGPYLDRSYNLDGKSRVLCMPGDECVRGYVFVDRRGRSYPAEGVTQSEDGIVRVTPPRWAAKIIVRTTVDGDLNPITPAMQRALRERLPGVDLPMGPATARLMERLVSGDLRDTPEIEKALLIAHDMQRSEPIYTFMEHVRPIIKDAGANAFALLEGTGAGSCYPLSFSLCNRLNRAGIPAVIISGDYKRRAGNDYLGDPGHAQVLVLTDPPMVLDPTTWMKFGKGVDAANIPAPLRERLERCETLTPQAAFELGVALRPHVIVDKPSPEEGHELCDLLPSSSLPTATREVDAEHARAAYAGTLSLMCEAVERGGRSDGPSVEQASSLLLHLIDSNIQVLRTAVDEPNEDSGTAPVLRRFLKSAVSDDRLPVAFREELAARIIRHATSESLPEWQATTDLVRGGHLLEGSSGAVVRALAAILPEAFSRPPSEKGLPAAELLRDVAWCAMRRELPSTIAWAASDHLETLAGTIARTYDALSSARGLSAELEAFRGSLVPLFQTIAPHLKERSPGHFAVTAVGALDGAARDPVPGLIALFRDSSSAPELFDKQGRATPQLTRALSEELMRELAKNGASSFVSKLEAVEKAFGLRIDFSEHRTALHSHIQAHWDEFVTRPAINFPGQDHAASELIWAHPTLARHPHTAALALLHDRGGIDAAKLSENLIPFDESAVAQEIASSCTRISIDYEGKLLLMFAIKPPVGRTVRQTEISIPGGPVTCANLHASMRSEHALKEPLNMLAWWNEAHALQPSPAGALLARFKECHPSAYEMLHENIAPELNASVGLVIDGYIAYFSTRIPNFEAKLRCARLACAEACIEMERGGIEPQDAEARLRKELHAFAVNHYRLAPLPSEASLPAALTEKFENTSLGRISIEERPWFLALALSVGGRRDRQVDFMRVSGSAPARLAQGPYIPADVRISSELIVPYTQVSGDYTNRDIVVARLIAYDRETKGQKASWREIRDLLRSVEHRIEPLVGSSGGHGRRPDVERGGRVRVAERTENILGARAFTPSDDPRFIDQALLARTGERFVREYGASPTPMLARRVAFHVDASMLGAGPGKPTLNLLRAFARIEEARRAGMQVSVNVYFQEGRVFHMSEADIRADFTRAAAGEERVPGERLFGNLFQTASEVMRFKVLDLPSRDVAGPIFSRAPREPRQGRDAVAHVLIADEPTIELTRARFPEITRDPCFHAPCVLEHFHLHDLLGMRT